MRTPAIGQAVSPPNLHRARCTSAWEHAPSALASSLLKDISHIHLNNFCATVNFPGEIQWPSARLLRRPARHSTSRSGVAQATSHTFVQSPSIEIFRMMLPAEESVPVHRVPGAITVQCLEGTPEFDAHGPPAKDARRRPYPSGASGVACAEGARRRFRSRHARACTKTRRDVSFAWASTAITELSSRVGLHGDAAAPLRTLRLKRGRSQKAVTFRRCVRSLGVACGLPQSVHFGGAFGARPS